MFEGDLLVELQDLQEEQDREYEIWEKRVIDLATAERDYQIIARQKALAEKANGTPITFINMFIKGDEDVAKARYTRDIAQALAEISKNKITDLRKRREITFTQAQSEWSRRDDYIPTAVARFE